LFKISTEKVIPKVVSRNVPSKYPPASKRNIDNPASALATAFAVIAGSNISLPFCSPTLI